MVEIAVVGDVHGAWDAADVAWFDRSGHALLALLGDLGGWTWPSCLRVAREIGRLRRPALLVPGNHDTAHLWQLLGEVLARGPLHRALTAWPGRQAARLRALEAALGDVALAGYSRHPVPGAPDVEIIAARPHSMGGPALAFRPHVARRWGIASLEASARALARLVDESPAPRLVFVGHNGPTGLGDARDAIWGADFRREGGDFGDPDLRAAIEHARASGRRVEAVVAGHLHLRVRGTERERPWSLRRDGVLYVNAARVPRIARGPEGVTRHHVALRLHPGGGCDAREVYVTEAGTEAGAGG